ncbi:MAG: putative transposase, partial [Deltaproteobacteria bacterium]|nr:putative transposase [Deltaproteobacteria bacterium]
MPREAEFDQYLCLDMQGFSLHSALCCGAEVRQAIEQLCRYFTRPALANARVQTSATGQVVLKLKTPYREGTTRPVMSQLELMQMHINGRFVATRSTGSTSAVGRQRAPAPGHRRTADSPEETVARAQERLAPNPPQATASSTKAASAAPDSAPDLAATTWPS